MSLKTLHPFSNTCQGCPMIAYHGDDKETRSVYVCQGRPDVPPEERVVINDHRVVSPKWCPLPLKVQRNASAP